MTTEQAAKGPMAAAVALSEANVRALAHMANTTPEQAEAFLAELEARPPELDNAGQRMVRALGKAGRRVGRSLQRDIEALNPYRT